MSYRIWNGPPTLSINESSGWIFTTQPLNPGHFIFTVVASDGGNPRKESSVMVNVTVYNETKGLAFTQRSFSFKVLEEMPGGQSVGQVTVRNTTVVTFNLSGRNIGLFNILRDSGHIVTTKPMDREYQEIYRLVVTAEDQSGYRVTANVTVTVNDVNDNSPVFEETLYRVGISFHV